jgi:hypothetical protein
MTSPKRSGPKAVGVFVLWIAVALLGTLQANGQPPKKSVPSRPTPATTSPVPLNITVSPSIAIPPAQIIQTNSDGEGSRADWAMVWLTAAATITGLLLLVLAGVQLRTQSRQTNEALTLARNSNETARRAADDAVQAAERSLKQALNEMYLTLRARMGLNEMHVVDFGPDLESLIRLNFRNFGGKGAFIVEQNIYYEINAALPAAPSYPSTNWVAVACNIEAGDNYEVVILVQPRFTTADWQSITDESGTTRLRVVGNLKYKAGFSDEPKSLKFCREYDPQLARLRGLPFKAVGGPAYNNAE